MEILQGLLDNTLNLKWTPEEHQFLVFSLCSYFLIDQDLVFSSFYLSLKQEYVLEDEKDKFLGLIYQITEAG